MIEFLTLFRVLLELFIGLGRTSGSKMGQPLLTVVFLVCAYTAIHMIQEGSVEAGIRTAFLENDC